MKTDNRNLAMTKQTLETGEKKWNLAADIGHRINLMGRTLINNFDSF